MGMIPNNIAFQDFVTNIRGGLLVDSNRYEIKLILPAPLISAYGLSGVDNPIVAVQLRCNDIRIPGRSVERQDLSTSLLKGVKVHILLPVDYNRESI